MKKGLLALLALMLMLILSLTACSSSTNTPAGGTTDSNKETGSAASEGVTVDNIKIGFIHLNDPSDLGFTYSHNLGTEKMKKNIGLRDDQIINKFNVPETSACETAMRELAEAGCNIICCVSFGYEDYMMEVAKDYPNIQFCHAAGYNAKNSSLDNVHNYFGNIYEARYLSGIAAGLKTKTNILGYVTAMPFDECISGFTAFYLGAKSVNPDVTMKVMYTNAWNDPTLESQVAQALIGAGADVLGQHTDCSATQTTAEANGIWSIGYNSDMINAAPNAVLTSVRWDWSVYLTKAVKCVLDDEKIPVDWGGGIKDGVCDITELNEKTVAPGTAEAIAVAREKIVSGDLYVFTGPLKGEGTNRDGKKETIDLKAGEKFIEPDAAPSWCYIIDGITVVK